MRLRLLTEGLGLVWMAQAFDADASADPVLHRNDSSIAWKHRSKQLSHDHLAEET